MWTKAHRARHEARLKEMVRVSAVGEMARWLERADPPRSPRRTPLRWVVAALAWHLRVGGPWRALPVGFPPWRTVYGWFRRWLEAGLLEALMWEIARLRRRAAGRRARPRLGIIDTQSVKCIGVRGPRGYDAGKGVWGRKRVALVDAAGHWLAIAVVPASVQDRDTLPALDRGKAAWPSLRAAVYDGAFTAERCREWSNLHGMRHCVVERDPAAKSLPLRRQGALSSSPGAGWWSGRSAGLPIGMACCATAPVASMSPLDAWPSSPSCLASKP
jgi:putative transposase